jgi:ribosomal protein S18 acetylase RimI-like enzyme
MAEGTISLQTLAQVPHDALVQAVNAAYADYAVPVFLTPASFRKLVTREDIALEHSVAALCGDQLVGTGFLAVRAARAWIGGLGVLPGFRRQGIGRRMMSFLLEHAYQAGCSQVQLEVITFNAGALALYHSLGFRKRRRLSVLFSDGDGPLPDPDPQLRIDDESPAALLRALPGFPAVEPPWQHATESMWTAVDRMDGFAARDHLGDLVGACLWSGDETQAGLLALAGRSPEVGAALLAALRRRLTAARLVYMNVPEGDPMWPPLLAAGFAESLAQYEMWVERPEELDDGTRC